MLYCDGREGGIGRGVMLLGLCFFSFNSSLYIYLFPFFPLFFILPSLFNILASFSVASFGSNFPGVVGCGWVLALGPPGGERGRQKEEGKAGKPWWINRLDWTEHGIGLWTMEMAMDGMCFLGWHMANHWRPDCFCFFVFS